MAWLKQLSNVAAYMAWDYHNNLWAAMNVWKRWSTVNRAYNWQQKLSEYNPLKYYHTC